MSRSGPPGGDPREEGARFVQGIVEQARSWGEQAQTRRAEVVQESRRRHLIVRLLLGILMIPVGLASAILAAGVGLIVFVAGLLALILLAWIAMIVIGGVIARGRGWPYQIGSLLGFLLGPIGVFLVQRFPGRR